MQPNVDCNTRRGAGWGLIDAPALQRETITSKSRNEKRERLFELKGGGGRDERKLKGEEGELKQLAALSRTHQGEIEREGEKERERAVEEEEEVGKRRREEANEKRKQLSVITQH